MPRSAAFIFSIGEKFRLAEEKLRDLRAQGLDAEKVIIDVEELLVWCKNRGLSVDASARSQYVAELVRKRDLH